MVISIRELWGHFRVGPAGGHDGMVLSVRDLHKVGMDRDETLVFTAFRGHVGRPAATTALRLAFGCCTKSGRTFTKHAWLNLWDKGSINQLRPTNFLKKLPCLS